MKTVERMRKIAVALDASGSVETVENTKLYRGSFGFVKLQCYVPVTQASAGAAKQLCTVHRAVLDEYGRRKTFNQEKYNMVYVGTTERNGKEYMLFESPLPKPYTDTTGALQLVFNYVATDSRGNGIALLTSETYETTVDEGGAADGTLTLTLPEHTAGQVNSNTAAIEQLKSDIEDLTRPPDCTDAGLVGTPRVEITEEGRFKFSELKGQPAEVEIGTVQTVAHDAPAAVTNSGDTNKVVLDFEIPHGKAAEVAVGAVKTVAYDAPAKITNSGTAHEATLDFEIPQGKPAFVKIGQVTTLPPESAARVENVGTENDPVLNFYLPEGIGFRITKTYPSVKALQAGFATDDVPLYGFVIIDTGDVEDADNAKLFIKEEDGYKYLTDLSGSRGIIGPQGGTGKTALGCTAFPSEAHEPAYYATTAMAIDAGTFNRPPDVGDCFLAPYLDTEQNVCYMCTWIVTETGEERAQCRIERYAKTGDVSDLPADRIILQEDITLAGDYVSVGNIGKGTAAATTTYPAKGKTVAAFLSEMFAKRLQPQIVRQPSVSGFTFDMAGRNIEVGTHFPSLSVDTIQFDSGAYTYDSETGVQASGYSIRRVMNGTETEISAEPSCTDTNDDNGFTVGDDTSIAYKGTIAYTQGNVANDNLGAPSDPIVQIQAGSATATASPLTGYRNYFYGTTSGTPPTGTAITSAFVRGLTASNRAYAANTFTLDVPAGATGVYIACIATRAGVTKVVNETALNADVTGSFTKQTSVDVEGANDYTAAPYNVWHYIPAVSYAQAARLKVTLG